MFVKMHLGVHAFFSPRFPHLQQVLWQSYPEVAKPLPPALYETASRLPSLDEPFVYAMQTQNRWKVLTKVGDTFYLHDPEKVLAAKLAGYAL